MQIILITIWHKWIETVFAVQRFGIMVHDGRTQENLKIAEHVRNQESEEKQTSYGHNGLLADRGFVESRHPR